MPSLRRQLKQLIREARFRLAVALIRHCPDPHAPAAQRLNQIQEWVDNGFLVVTDAFHDYLNTRIQTHVATGFTGTD